MVSPKFYKINSLTSLFHETFLTSTFSERRLPDGITLRPDDLRSLNVQDRRSIHGRRTHQVFIGIHVLHHEKVTLEVHEVTKLHSRDTSPSYDEFSSHALSIKLIPTTYTIHPGNNDTLHLYSKGATLSNFIDEGRLTPTKQTFVTLPSSTSHSTFHECSRGIP